MTTEIDASYAGAHPSMLILRWVLACGLVLFALLLPAATSQRWLYEEPPLLIDSITDPIVKRVISDSPADNEWLNATVDRLVEWEELVKYQAEYDAGRASLATEHELWLRDVCSTSELSPDAEGYAVGTDSAYVLSRILRTYEQGVDTVLPKPENFDGMDLRSGNFAGALLGEYSLKAKTTRPCPGEGQRVAEFEGGSFGFANLFEARLFAANLQDANFSRALLMGADLGRTDLSAAFFFEADLRGADLAEANLANANFTRANLAGVRFEPLSDKLPDLGTLSSATGLTEMRYYENASGLYTLRKSLDNQGLADLARQITVAIHRSETERAFNYQGAEEDWQRAVGMLTATLQVILFDWTTVWGLQPERPLVLLGLLIPAFAVFYLYALYRPGSGAIWFNRPQGAINGDSIGWRPVTSANRRGLAALLRFCGIALWFSVLCAFRIGFREFSVGDWIARLQPREFTMAASGWARSTAGLQSLISLYLVAMSILCIFGRPFG